MFKLERENEMGAFMARVKQTVANLATVQRTPAAAPTRRVVSNIMAQARGNVPAGIAKSESGRNLKDETWKLLSAGDRSRLTAAESNKARDGSFGALLALKTRALLKQRRMEVETHGQH